MKKSAYKKIKFHCHILYTLISFYSSRRYFFFVSASSLVNLVMKYSFLILSVFMWIWIWLYEMLEFLHRMSKKTLKVKKRINESFHIKKNCVAKKICCWQIIWYILWEMKKVISCVFGFLHRSLNVVFYSSSSLFGIAHPNNLSTLASLTEL